MKLKDLKQKINELKNEDYMSDEQLSLFKIHLKSSLAEVEELRENLKQRYSQIDGNPADQLDKAEVNNQQGEINQSLDKLKVTEQEIISALRLIDRDDFGYCIKCGNEVGLQRLLSNPCAVRDIDCQSLHELKLKQEGRL